MAFLNQLLSETDLLKLSHEEREFLVQRIDHELDTSPEIREIVASSLQRSVDHLNKGAGIRVRG